jgi:hypothetical protein
MSVELNDYGSGYRIKNSIFAAKPLTSLTEYTRDRVALGLRPPPTHTAAAERKDGHVVPLPNDRYDYAVALRFGLAADRSSDFLVLLESEKIRQFWNMELHKPSSEDLEITLERRLGSFRTAALPTGVDPDMYQIRAEQSLKPNPRVAVTAYIAGEYRTKTSGFRLVVEVKDLPSLAARDQRQTQIFELPG